MPFVSYPFYILFAILPSLIWLIFYLSEDNRPEPKSMVIKVFFFGLIITLPAIFLEIAMLATIEKLPFSPSFLFFLNIFLGVALTEEVLKFLVIKEKVLASPEFDEPVDAMIYPIIAGLGFAAGENLLIFLPLKVSLFQEMLWISLLFRFLGATFLHALCAAIFGFFLGLSFFEKKKRVMFISFGLFLAICLHGVYNFSIIKLGGGLRFLILAFLLGTVAILVSLGFQKLKNLVKI